MPRFISALIISALLLTHAASTSTPRERSSPIMPTLQLHPKNPHYFLYQNKPTLLVTSGEHYGAVLNRAFDYKKYLATLHKDGLNLTRIFTGAYMEHSGAFNITQNTLAPEANQLLCPWKRSDTPGYANGGHKFDLHAWDDAYFARLKDFLHTAAAHDVIVEVCLFCPFYGEEQWAISPMRHTNNINDVGNIATTDVYTLDKNGALLGVQEAMVRKFVAELNNFDNFYFEICNEPYFGGVTLEWQAHIADVITAAEASLPKQHLISQNIANEKLEVTHPDPHVSILNFHYAHPPDTVAMNFSLQRVIGENETGFNGTGDTYYRMEGWEFMLAGGGLYNNLDYSFTVGHEDGTFSYPDTQPGGGTPALRRQLGILKQFLDGFDFLRMKPDPSVITGTLGEGQRARVLAESGQQYAIYVFGGPRVSLPLDVPKGSYIAKWLNPVTGQLDKQETLTHAGGPLTLTSPDYVEDIAVSIKALAKNAS